MNDRDMGQGDMNNRSDVGRGDTEEEGMGTDGTGVS